MPRTEIDYTKTIIYKIQHIENPELLYVGHTTNFNKRKSEHKMNCKNEKKTFKLYLTIRENGGWEMFKMIPVKEVSCTGRYGALREEDNMMTALKASLNMYHAIAPRSIPKSEEQKAKAREKYHENMSKLKEMRKELDLKYETLYPTKL
jgi:hypothetical protein